MLEDNPGHVFDLLDLVRTKLCRYNPEDPKPEVLESAIGNLNAVTNYCPEIAALPQINSLFVTVINHLISLDRPNVEFMGGLPDVRQTREAALTALANLRAGIAEHRAA